MRLPNLPVLSALVGVSVAVSLLYWYQWSASPLSQKEVDNYIATLSAQTQIPGGRHDLDAVRDLLEHDDGKPVYTLNLYSFRDVADYPAGSGFSGTGEEAFSRFQRAMVRLTPKRAAHPVFSTSWTHDRTNDWDRVVIMRHRSRRDLADMFASDEFADASMHKWAAIETLDRSVVEAIQLPDGQIAILLLGVLSGLVFYASGRGFRARRQPNR